MTSPQYSNGKVHSKAKPVAINVPPRHALSHTDSPLWLSSLFSARGKLNWRVEFKKKIPRTHVNQIIKCSDNIYSEE